MENLEFMRAILSYSLSNVDDISECFPDIDASKLEPFIANMLDSTFSVSVVQGKRLAEMGYKSPFSGRNWIDHEDTFFLYKKSGTYFLDIKHAHGNIHAQIGKVLPQGAENTLQRLERGYLRSAASLVMPKRLLKDLVDEIERITKEIETWNY